MGDFGADTLKPTWLYSNCPRVRNIKYYAIRQFRRGQGKTVCKSVQRADGSVNVMGDAGLKQTENYPDPFGIGVRELMLDNSSHQDRLLSNNARHAVLPKLCDCLNCDPWTDAGLDDVMQTLCV